MTREDITKLFPEASSEQVTSLLNQFHSELDAEKEKAKQIAKGPGWMQRMMEQSQQQLAEQEAMNGGSGNGNRTRYMDGDDGMSRKERAEYEKTLIEAARKRAALKYGDDVPEGQSSDPE